MKLVWKVQEVEDKQKNVCRIIYSKYSKKKDRKALIKRLLDALDKQGVKHGNV